MLGALAVTSPVAAVECPEDTGKPKQMEQKGQALFEEALRREPADPARALELLLCVQRFADKPAVALRIGIVAERLGKTALAVASFERYLALAGADAPDRAEMQAHIERLREKLPKQTPEPRAEPQPDPIPEPVIPGAEPRKRPIAGWALTAGGGVLVILGGVLLWTAKQRSDDVHDIEPGKTFWNSEEARSEHEQAKREQALGILSLALGAAAATVGVVLVATADSELSAGASASRDGVRGSLRLSF
jgi:hypothetical protein